MPLTDRTIATVGSGVMAEAMIAGLLRGGQVTPDRIVASHPRADRRALLERDYGIQTAASNTEAVTGADVVVLAIKPQMLARVGRELAPALTDEDPQVLEADDLGGRPAGVFGSGPEWLGAGLTVLD